MIWSGLFILWLVLIIGTILAFIIIEDFGPRKEGFIYKKTIEGNANMNKDKQIVKNDNTPIVRENLEIINWHMAGSYNSCFSSNHNKASIESLEKVLKEGIRCLDFEVFLKEEINPLNKLRQKVAIVGSTLNNVEDTEAIKRCEDPNISVKMKTRYPNDTVKISDVFKTIYLKGFFDNVNKDYPIFINLRIKTPNPDVYIKLKEDLENSELFKNNKVLDVDYYGYAQNYISNPDNELIYQELVNKKFKQKIIFMIEDYCKNYEESSFYKYIHFDVKI